MISIFNKNQAAIDNKSMSNNPQKDETLQVAAVSSSQSLIYPKPKVLLIDMKEESEKTLKAAGYKIDVGTFGESYKVEKSPHYELITPSASLPNYREQEVIIIDLASPETKDKSSVEKQDAIVGNYYYWVKKNYGVINIRPAMMSAYSSSFNNILRSCLETRI